MEIQTGTTFSHNGLEYTITAVVLGRNEEVTSFIAIAYNGSFYISTTFNVAPHAKAA